MTTETQGREGAVRRAWRWLAGSHPRLRESEGRTSWLSYLLMLVQSLTLVLIGGSVELRTLLSDAPLQLKAIVSLSLGILILGAYAADMATMRTQRRIGVLLRHRRVWLACEHLLYAAFVYGVEGATYAVALYVIMTNPEALLSGASILPTTLLVVGVMVGVRALIIVWTSIQLNLIAEPLAANEVTLMRQAVEKAGGHASVQLDNLQLQARDLPTVVNAIAEMSKPPRRIPHWWNGWLRRRDALVEREQDALRARQIAALQALNHDEVAEAHAQATQDVALARADAQRLIETAQRQVEAARDAATQRTLDAILSLVATGALPDWLIEQRPDLAGFSLAQLAGGAGGNGGRGRKGGGLSAMPAREPASQADRVRLWLSQQGIEPCRAPEGKRGVWLRAADVDVLTDGHASASETHQQLVKRLGSGAIVGRALVAPFEPVMRALAERHLLTDEARMWWEMQSHSGEDAADNRDDGRSNVVAMRA